MNIAAIRAFDEGRVMNFEERQRDYWIANPTLAADAIEELKRENEALDRIASKLQDTCHKQAQQLAAMTKELDEWKEAAKAANGEQWDLARRLAASQAREARLREALNSPFEVCNATLLSILNEDTRCCIVCGHEDFVADVCDRCGKRF